MKLVICPKCGTEVQVPREKRECCRPEHKRMSFRMYRPLQERVEDDFLSVLGFYSWQSFFEDAIGKGVKRYEKKKAASLVATTKQPSGKTIYTQYSTEVRQTQ